MSVLLLQGSDGITVWLKWEHPTQGIVNLDKIDLTPYPDKGTPWEKIGFASGGNDSYEIDKGNIAYPLTHTARAVSIGVGIAMLDGPLPVMDVVALGVATYLAADAWIDWWNA